jgi:hypothetical protein
MLAPLCPFVMLSLSRILALWTGLIYVLALAAAAMADIRGNVFSDINSVLSLLLLLAAFAYNIKCPSSPGSDIKVTQINLMVSVSVLSLLLLSTIAHLLPYAIQVDRPEMWIGPGLTPSP